MDGPAVARHAVAQHDHGVLLRVAVISAAVATGAATVTAACGVVLARVYRPSGGFLDTAAERRTVRVSQWWSDLHLVALLVFVVASLVSIMAVWLLRRARAGARGALVLAVVAAAAATVTAWTRSLVRWEQLALWAVTTGRGISGYWYAAFDRGVRFVFVDSVEVSQGSYAWALVVHLAAPIVGAVALGAMLVLLLRSRASLAA